MAEADELLVEKSGRPGLLFRGDGVVKHPALMALSRMPSVRFFCNLHHIVWHLVDSVKTTYKPGDVGAVASYRKALLVGQQALVDVFLDASPRLRSAVQPLLPPAPSVAATSGQKSGDSFFFKQAPAMTNPDSKAAIAIVTKNAKPGHPRKAASDPNAKPSESHIGSQNAAPPKLKCAQSQTEEQRGVKHRAAQAQPTLTSRKSQAAIRPRSRAAACQAEPPGHDPEDHRCNSCTQTEPRPAPEETATQTNAPGVSVPSCSVAVQTETPEQVPPPAAPRAGQASPFAALASQLDVIHRTLEQRRLSREKK